MNESSLAIALAILAGLIAYLNGLKQHQRGVYFDGVAIVHVYISTINATRKSLASVRNDPLLDDALSETIPLGVVHDFRREDWFAIHHSLSGDLGKLVHLNPKVGPEAVSAVSAFFQDLKYAREVFAYALAVQRAAVEHRSEGLQSELPELQKHLMHRLAEINRYIVKLEGDAAHAVKLLQSLDPESNRLKL